jgi:hypothetical protein
MAGIKRKHHGSDIEIQKKSESKNGVSKQKPVPKVLSVEDSDTTDSENSKRFEGIESDIEPQTDDQIVDSDMFLDGSNRRKENAGNKTTQNDVDQISGCKLLV